ncbi:MAG: hypothetical protein LBE48_06075 [Methanomassiliicoccaceae archaeon]|jgi:hypothetical protein|nr:hypothetical protein [Methanomassiliicoccaceae archaeon]
MDIQGYVAGLDTHNRAFVNEIGELLAVSCKIRITEKDSMIRLTYICRTDKRALFNLKISGNALSVHIYADNINKYIGEIPDDMTEIIIKGRECDGKAEHTTCIGGYRLVTDGKEYNKCRYMNFKFDVNDDTREQIKKMIMNEMSYR